MKTKFLNRHERPTYEFNGGQTGKRRPTIKMSTLGDWKDDFQIECTHAFMVRIDTLRAHCGERSGIPAPPRTKFLAALVNAAWMTLKSNGNIKIIKFNYKNYRITAAAPTPREKLATLANHLVEQGLPFPTNGPSAMAATARLLVECAYDSLHYTGEFSTITFNYEL